MNVPSPFDKKVFRFCAGAIKSVLPSPLKSPTITGEPFQKHDSAPGFTPCTHQGSTAVLSFKVNVPSPFDK